MFRIVNHTADIGLAVTGKTEEELFVESARGMLSILADEPVKEEKGPHKHKGRVFSFQKQEANLESLLVAFLNELLYLIEKEKAIFSNFSVKLRKARKGYTLKCRVSGNGKEIKREIKAATYHNLKIEKEGENFKTTIIFDL